MILKDHISFNDKIVYPSIAMPEAPKGLWARTEVIGGYGDVNYSKTGKSTLGEVCFKSHNMVPIGGVQYTMEKLYGVKGPFEIPTLYDQTLGTGASGIGIQNSTEPTETYMTPNGDKAIIYRYGNQVQLMGIGITGAAENDVTVYPVDYRENSIELSKVTTDGTSITGTMIPFRYTAETLSEVERRQYFGKYTDQEGITGYYLKKFESDVAIKHVWTTGEDDDSETAVTSDELWVNNTGTNTVESFSEMILKITKKDVKEWFTALDQIDRSRINTIALFTGEYIKDVNDVTDFGDYRDVMMFSKLQIPVEYLSLAKDLNIIYRVYGS